MNEISDLLFIIKKLVIQELKMDLSTEEYKKLKSMLIEIKESLNDRSYLNRTSV